MGKHAYLIMAHNDFSLLKKLLVLTDYENNDIYLHIDKRAEGFDLSCFQKIVKKSNLFFVDRINIEWGGESLITCELLLLKEATKKGYDYYHLLSGVDLPLKKQSEIHNFFKNNGRYEYMEFDKEAIESGSFLHRCKYWYFFQNKKGKKKGIVPFILKYLEIASISIQKLFKVNRMSNNDLEYYKGSNWFSITHDLASYVLGQEKNIKKYFFKSLCADEIFLQTIAMNSPFKETIIDDYLRYIDWDRGSPYTFTCEDIERLKESDKLWARKFSTEKDETVINTIYQYIQTSQNS